jgi:hypothetical protein
VKKTLAGMSIAVSLLAACSSTLLVSKEGKGYFLGSGSKGMEKMLCESGDLRKVLSDTQLPQPIKEDLYRYNCSPEKSREKIKQIYESMTEDQRRDLRLSFANNGYMINYLPCCGDVQD